MDRRQIIHLAYRNLHTSSVTWRKGKAQIPLSNEEIREVPATTLGVFAVHKSIEGSAWVVTHIPSGKSITHFKSSSVAKAYTEALIAENPEIAAIKTVSRLLPFAKAVRSLSHRPVQSWPVLESFDSTIRYTLDESEAQWVPPKKVVPKGPKLRTFLQARQEILAELVANNWAVQSRLKIPHATSPDGSFRLWFKAQAVYSTKISITGHERHNFQDARSLWSDIRKTSAKDFVEHIRRSQLPPSKTASMRQASVKWKKQRVYLFFPDTQQIGTVPASTLGVLAVHEDRGEPVWNITHIPSGGKLLSFKTSKLAKAFVEAIAFEMPEVMVLKSADKLRLYARQIIALSHRPASSWQSPENLEVKETFTFNKSNLTEVEQDRMSGEITEITIKSVAETIDETIALLVKEGWSEGKEGTNRTVEQVGSHLQVLFTKKDVFYRWAPSSEGLLDRRWLPIRINLKHTTGEKLSQDLQRMKSKLITTYKKQVPR